MGNKYKELSGNALMYAIVNIGPKIISFFLVSLYTSYLTKESYGIADLISTTSSLLVPIFTCCIADAVFRFALNEDADRTEIISLGGRFITIGMLILAVVAIIAAIQPFYRINPIYIIITYVSCVIGAYNSLINVICRCINKLNTVAIASIVHTLVAIGLNILFLVPLKMGLFGFLLSSVISNFVALVIVTVASGGLKLFSFKKQIPNKSEKLKSMLSYSMPQVVSNLSWWVNSSSDRYMVSIMRGVADSGLYAVGYKLPSILELIQNAFMQAWAISAIKHYDPDDSDGFIGKNYTLANTILVICCSVIMIICIPVAKLLFSNDFFYAWRFVPVLLVSVIFHAMSTFLGHLLLAAKQSKSQAGTVVIGALVNIVCNLILIKLFGAIGAAVATLICYLVIFITRYIIVAKYVTIKHNKRADFCVYFILLAQMAFALMGAKYIVWQIPFFLVIVIIYRKQIAEIALTIITFIKSKIKPKH